MDTLNTKTTQSYEISRNNADELVYLFTSKLSEIDHEIAASVDFSHQVQKNNLMNFINDSLDAIGNYESIYPFVKNLCSGQNIDPSMYKHVENTLKYVLEKGKGSEELFDMEIKDAWITYCALLSYSMIDATPKNVQVREGRRKRKNRTDSENIIAQLS